MCRLHESDSRLEARYNLIISQAAADCMSYYSIRYTV